MVDLGGKFKGKQIKSQGLTEQVSQVLTEAILDRTLGPGENLIETDLQKQLGVSRSPLREAFRDLEKKGLVTIIPRRGTFVKEITGKDLEENFPVRATLEGLAARQAYPRMTPAQLAEMANALEGMKQVGEAGDSDKRTDQYGGSLENRMRMPLLSRPSRSMFRVFRFMARDIPGPVSKRYFLFPLSIRQANPCSPTKPDRLMLLSQRMVMRVSISSSFHFISLQTNSDTSNQSASAIALLNSNRVTLPPPSGLQVFCFLASAWRSTISDPGRTDITTTVG